MALESFDGSQWTSPDSFRVAGPILAPSPADYGAAALTLTEHVAVRALTGPYLPVAGWPAQIDASLRPGALIGFDPDSGTLVADAASLAGGSYTVTARGQPADAGLADAAAGGGALFAPYIRLPPVPAPLAALATQVTAGARTPFAKLTAINDYLRKLPISLSAPPGDSYGALVRLLTADSPQGRAGDADQHASAFAILARIERIPARVMVGYRLSARAGRGNRTYTLTTADAYAWAQAYFQGYGWIGFDPTDTRHTVDLPPVVQVPEPPAAPPRVIKPPARHKRTPATPAPRSPHPLPAPGTGSRPGLASWPVPPQTAIPALVLLLCAALAGPTGPTGPTGPPTPTPAPTNTGGTPAYCSPGPSSSLSDQGGIPLSNADQPSGGQPQHAQQPEGPPQPAQPTDRAWGPAKIAIVTTLISGIIGGIFAVIIAVIPAIFPGRTGPGTSSTPTATSARSSSPATRPAPSPVPILTSPALTLTDPGGTGVYGVAFTRSGTLATGDLDGSAYLWNVAKDKVTGTFPDSNGQGIFGLAISPDGKLLAADTLNNPKYDKGAVVLWDTSARNPIATLTAPDGRGFGNPPALSPDNATVAAANADGSIYLWDTATGTPVGKPLTDPGSEIDYGIAFSPATGFLAAADYNKTTYLWNTKEAHTVRTFQDPGSRGTSGVAFGPDGSILATGDVNGNVYLWNAATGSPMATLHGPKGGTIQSIAFSPHRAILAATSNNDKDHEFVTCIWDLTGKPVAILQDPSSVGATRVAFSPDGSMLAVGDENAHTYIWNTNGFS